MAAITYKGESLIATKQAKGEVMNIDRIILANIPGLDPGKPVDRNEQLPPAEHIVLDDPVSQHGYINPNLVVYALHMGTGGDPFDFNWLGLYCSEDDTVVAINYMPTQGKDPSLAMTRNLMLEFSGAQETGDIHVPAESWMVDFSQRMDGTDGRSRQMTQDVFGRQLFYGDACKVVKGSGGYYDLLPGEGYVAGIRFDYPGKSVLVSETPTSIWLDVSQQGNAMSDIQPVVQVVVSDLNQSDYTDSNGIYHFLEKVTQINDSDIFDIRLTNNSATNAVTHDTFSHALLDQNLNRNYLRTADKGGTCWRKTNQNEYDGYPNDCKGIDKAGHYWVEWSPYKTVNRNYAVGLRALNSNLSGSTSIAIGDDALMSHERSNSNVAVGHRSMELLNRGDSVVYQGVHNVSLGRFTLRSSVSGFDNTAIGSHALELSTTGKANTAVGRNAMQGNTTGVDNVAVGEGSMPNNKTGNSNTAVGVNALLYNRDKDACVGIGAAAGFLINGTQNVFMGFRAGYGKNDGDGDGGLNDERSYIGNNNVCIGSRAMQQMDEASYNVAVGVDACAENINGHNNIAVGRRALEKGENVQSNIAIGSDALRDDNVTACVVIGNGMSSNGSNNKVIIGNLGNTVFEANHVTGQTFAFGEFLPNQNNQYSLGNGVYKWTEVFTINEAVTQSDENEKLIDDIPEVWLDAADKIKQIRFKWLYEIERHEEGNRQPARWHIGYPAQTVFKILEDAGINDPWELAFMCKDALEEELEDGTVLPLIDKDTGLQKERWGLRVGELNTLKLAAIERKLSHL